MLVVCSTSCSEIKHRKHLTPPGPKGTGTGDGFQPGVGEWKKSGTGEGPHLSVRTRAKAGQLNGELAVSQMGDSVCKEQRFPFTVTYGK